MNMRRASLPSFLFLFPFPSLNAHPTLSRLPPLPSLPSLRDPDSRSLPIAFLSLSLSLPLPFSPLPTFKDTSFEHIAGPAMRLLKSVIPFHPPRRRSTKNKRLTKPFPSLFSHPLLASTLLSAIRFYFPEGKITTTWQRVRPPLVTAKEGTRCDPTYHQR
ncbi:hypothetical protein IE53DRAFT_391185 [Violaceomyces palustris]|uniref:Uncharacterized protein n=1 Tax=Violaceomyces palustris TaxID=1673888 RepID=A0ACD0NLG7_9BASI|nr:hypothetical protein IE53DRAFT_391185 [Violaceomyces palustris]